MHTHYADILNRIPEAPRWFDEVAVPRYCEFSTDALAFIYAKEAALVLIQCQACEREFQVAFSELNARDRDRNGTTTIADLIRERRLHYGDPPNVGCCTSGASMNSVPVQVLQYWYRPLIRGEGVGPHPKFPSRHAVLDPKAMEFRRDPSLEVNILPDWARS